MHRWFVRQRWLIVALCVTLLMSGAPAVLGQVTARQNLLRLAVAAQAAERVDAVSASIGLPPDPQEGFLSNPVASGANPPYPLNHTLDADVQPVGTPPANYDFETPSTTTGTPPTNHDFETAPTDAGTPTNHAFASGDLSGWTTSGTVTAASDTPHGTYASLGQNGVLISAAFTVSSDAQAFILDIGFLTTSGYAQGAVVVLSDPTFSTSTSLLSLSCNACNRWETRTADAVPFRGQTIKLKVTRSAGTLGVDAARTEVIAPGYTLTGSGRFNRISDGSDAYLWLDNGGGLTTAAFTVASDAQFGSTQVSGLGAGNDNYGLYVLSGPTFGTSTLVASNSNAPDSWTTVRANLVGWRGQTIKLKVTNFAGTVGLDEIGVQGIDLAGWEPEAGEPMGVLSGGPSGSYVSTRGDLTSSAVTLPSDVQQVTLDYKSALNSIFYFELLRGPSFGTVVDLKGGTVNGDPTAWKTLVVSVQPYAGETVKLRVRQYFGTGLYDNVGLGFSVLPGWTLTTTKGMLTGEDASGSYIAATALQTTVYLRSVDLSPGILNRSAYVDQRFYSITYDIGYATASFLQVKWYNSAGQNWVVFTRAADTPTGVTTDYFWLADFMLDDPTVAGVDTLLDGYFQVQVPATGKLYQLADNIARQHLGEPFSEKVGAGIDTTTGSVGYQQQDLTTEGTMPLSFTRYYSSHADRVGVLGNRWSHTYETRLVVLANDDVGVIFGSGREEYFDWYTVFTDPPNRYVPYDARVHDTLVKNGDGTYTFTTTSNLSYVFTATGQLTSITDLNGNSTTLTYNGSGQLTTVTAPGNRTLTLAYDGNGRLASVTDPVGAVVSYSYDASGDLTTVTDPASNDWTYTYDRHRLTSVTDPNSDTPVSNTFDAVNRVLSQTDAADETLTVAYDTPSTGVTSVTDARDNTAKYYFDRYQRTTDLVDPLGNVETREYDAVGNLNKVIKPDGGEWAWSHDANGNPTTVTDPLGNPTSYTYNPLNQPLTRTDARNYTWTYVYDGAGNLSSLTDPLNGTTTYTYNSSGLVTSETDPLNHTTSYTYNAAGDMLTKTDALNHTWTWTYDAAGRVLTETDPLNQTTTYTRDFMGWIPKITDPEGYEFEFSYDAYGNIVWHEDPFDKRTTWAYDERANVVAKTGTLDNETTYTYDEVGNMLSMTDPLNHTTTYTWDDNNRLASITDPENGTTSYTYDDAGRLASETDALNRTTSYAYDDGGNLTSKTLPSGGIWTYTYDDNGNLLTETDPNNHTTSYAYDALNRLTSMTDALSGVVSFTYDAASRRTAVTNALGKTTTFTYDAVGNLLTQTDPLNRTRSWTYDAENRVASHTDARNITVSYSYDALDNRTGLTYPGGSISWEYDGLGRVTEMTDATGTTTWGYDAMSRTTAVAAPQGTVNYAYDDAGRRTSMTLPGSRSVSYGYDDAGRVTSLTDWQSRTISMDYNAAGQRTSITRPSGVETGFGYDSGGRLDAITHTNGGGTLQSFTYTLDAAGNRTAVTTNGGTESYTRDALNRLTSVSYAGGDVVSYTYDAQGNRLTQVVNGVTTATYTYDNAGQMTGDGATTYTYDANGNLTAAGSDTYTWDWNNRLTSATVGTTTENYAYDGNGVRVGKTVGGVTTDFLWDRPANGSPRTGCSCDKTNGAPLPLLVDDGTTAYLHADGLLVEIDAANAATYPLNDALGSVRGLTDGSGTLAGTAEYDVFGAIRSQTGATSDFGFTGEQRDATTGFTFLRARYLNPVGGRFVSQDTVQPNAPGTQGWNGYAYVANNPATWVDPSGHASSPCAQNLGNFALIVLGLAFAIALAVRMNIITGGLQAVLYAGLILLVVAAIFACILLGGFDASDANEGNVESPVSPNGLLNAPTAYPSLVRA